MHEARLRTSGAIVDADAFMAMPSSHREELRVDLECPACRADAFFRRESRDGRRACFGARPHGEECELASQLTEDGGGAALDETDERINAGDIFRIEPGRPHAVRHIKHDPGAAPATGSAVRYTGRGPSVPRVSSMSMDRLLRQLALRKSFRNSRTMLVLSDNTRGFVRTVCKHMSDVTDRDVNRRRIYWGSIRFPRPKDNGGAWLNTGSRQSPTVVIEQEILDAILRAAQLEDLEDISGSFFAFMGPLRRSQGGKLLLFAEDTDWFALRPYKEDAGIE